MAYGAWWVDRWLLSRQECEYYSCLQLRNQEAERGLNTVPGCNPQGLFSRDLLSLARLYLKVSQLLKTVLLVRDQIFKT